MWFWPVTAPLWSPGTLFLWIFWPRFNSYALTTPQEKSTAIFNTYFALAVSAVTATSVSALAHPQGKINLVRRGCAWGRTWVHQGAHIHAWLPPLNQPPGSGLTKPSLSATWEEC